MGVTACCGAKLRQHRPFTHDFFGHTFSEEIRKNICGVEDWRQTEGAAYVSKPPIAGEIVRHAAPPVKALGNPDAGPRSCFALAGTFSTQVHWRRMCKRSIGGLLT
jgi:hypothetical protein